MKLQKQFITLACTLILTSFIYQDASKRETVDWIKSRCYYYKQYSDTEFGINRIELFDYDFKNDTLFYKVQNYHGGNGFRVDAIPIRQINPERLRIVRLFGSDEDLGIELYTSYGKENIVSYIYLDSNDKKPYKSYYNMVKIYLPGSKLKAEPDLPDRMFKALKHLFKLCGNKGEKF